MFIPYLDRIGVGVALGRNGIHYVRLKRRLNKITLLNHQFLPFLETVEKTLQQIDLSDLKSYPFIATSLPAFLVNYKQVEISNQEEWIVQEQLEDAIEEWKVSLGQDEIAVQSVAIPSEYDGLQYLLVSVSQEAIAQQKSLLENLGIRVGLMSGGNVDAWLAFTTDSNEENKEEALFIQDKNQLDIWLYRNKSLFYVDQIDFEEPKYVKEEVDFILKSNFSDPDLVEVLWVSADLAVQPYPTAKVLPGIELKKSLPAESVTAVGLAMRMLFPQLGGVNFLDNEQKHAFKIEIDKFHAIRYILSTGTILLVFLIGIWFGGWYFQNEIRKDSAAFIVAKKTQLKADSIAKHVNDKHYNLNKSISFLNSRTKISPLLYQIGKSVPYGIWLSNVEIKGLGNVEIIVEGYSEQAEFVTAYIETLNTKFQLESIETKHLDGETALSQTKVNSRPLTAFTIKLIRE